MDAPTQSECVHSLFISFGEIVVDNNHVLFFRNVVFFLPALLGYGQMHCETKFTPSQVGCEFLASKKTIFFFWGLVVWMLHIGRARHPGPVRARDIPGHLSIEFAGVGGWVTHGAMAFGFMCSVLGCR